MFDPAQMFADDDKRYHSEFHSDLRQALHRKTFLSVGSDMTDMKNTIDMIADVLTHQAVRLISIGHSGNETDMTDMKNTIDTQTDVVTHQVICFVSSDNADVNALSSSLFQYVIVPAVSKDTWIQSNNVEANFCCFHRTSVFGVRLLMVENRFHQDTSQDRSQEMWQTQAAHQSNKNYECDDYIFEFENDYIFVFATEVNEKTTIELDDVPEENYMTVYVKTINGKTISIKCDKKQKAASTSDEVERRSSIPRGLTYLVHQGKVKTEMSLRLLGGMDESDMKDTSETEEEREKRKLEETGKSKSKRTSEESIFLQKETIDALRKSEEKMEIHSKNPREDGHISADNHGFSRNTAPWMNSTIVKMKEEDDRYKQISEIIMNMEKKILDMDEKL